MKEIFKNYAAVVFFDTETTGLDPREDRIIELAARRISQFPNGNQKIESLDVFVKLPEGKRIPEKITKLTGITDEMLEREGVSEADACGAFSYIIRNDEGPVLLIAHNAQFDLLFVRAMLGAHEGDGLKLLARAFYLDSLTVYKDRRPYPHKLVDAIAAYGLQDKVKNSHRAIDDVEALFEVCKAMDDERADLATYVNVFGYNPRYGVNGYRIDGVTYWPQHTTWSMVSPNLTLPAIMRRCKK